MRRLAPSAARARVAALLAERSELYAEAMRLDGIPYTEVIELARKLFPKRKVPDFAKTWKLVKDHPEVTAIQTRHREKADFVRKLLDATAAELDRYCEIAEMRSSDRWLSAEVVRSGDYHTQGLGATRYAEGAAEIYVLAAKAIGVDAVLWRESSRVDYGASPSCFRGESHHVTFVVSVRLDDETDLQIMKRRRFMTLRDQVKACWKFGVNPRVYMPMLTPGFEERHGLDYFGNDVAPRAGSI